MYLDYVKTIPSDIAENFNVVALSYFVMSAGSLHASGLIINMGNYGPEGRKIMRAMLVSNFGIDSTLHSRGRVYINAKNKVKLHSIISPYLHSSRLYLFNKTSSK